jgi:hypothetical protein
MTPIAEQVAREGFSVVAGREIFDLARRDPWLAAEQLFGAPATMVERQTLRAFPDGRSFASSARAAPLHTDSQLFAGLPPDWQVLFCVRAAGDGGHTLLLDSWPWLLRLAERNATLFAALFAVHRRIPFVFGDVLTPTVACARRRLLITHSPMPAHDDIGQALVAALPPPRHVPLRAGDLLVVDNHRVLHGRTAFGDRRREMLRILVWLPEYRAAPESLVAAARSLDAGLARRLDAPPPAIGERERQAVAAMMRGEAPGRLARDLGIPEAHLYAWRDALHASFGAP